MSGPPATRSGAAEPAPRPGTGDPLDTRPPATGGRTGAATATPPATGTVPEEGPLQDEGTSRGVAEDAGSARNGGTAQDGGTPADGSARGGAARDDLSVYDPTPTPAAEPARGGRPDAPGGSTRRPAGAPAVGTGAAGTCQGTTSGSARPSGGAPSPTRDPGRARKPSAGRGTAPDGVPAPDRSGRPGPAGGAVEAGVGGSGIPWGPAQLALGAALMLGVLGTAGYHGVQYARATTRRE
ncbi:hypothetical protein [Streptomyces sp. TS71-3]|uniref:hypothetical protein n=1 Tax=Streptomyces sp. TS71-3 TaxID=2733862 RepID=UPI001BB38D78|nr:hypothetical protein [Streptomyces sp. TS71-3]